MPLKHRYLRGKHCQIDTLLSKAVIEKMYTDDFCGRNFLKYHTFQDFLRRPFLLIFITSVVKCIACLLKRFKLFGGYLMICQPSKKI